MHRDCFLVARNLCEALAFMANMCTKIVGNQPHQSCGKNQHFDHLAM